MQKFITASVKSTSEKIQGRIAACVRIDQEFVPDEWWLENSNQHDLDALQVAIQKSKQRHYNKMAKLNKVS